MGDGEIDRLAFGLAKRDLGVPSSSTITSSTISSSSSSRTALSAGIAVARSHPRTISGLLRNFIKG
jgi:hypothetical protein